MCSFLFHILFVAQCEFILIQCHLYNVAIFARHAHGMHDYHFWSWRPGTVAPSPELMSTHTVKVITPWVHAQQRGGVITHVCPSVCVCVCLYTRRCSRPLCELYVKYMSWKCENISFYISHDWKRPSKISEKLTLTFLKMAFNVDGLFLKKLLPQLQWGNRRPFSLHRAKPIYGQRSVWVLHVPSQDTALAIATLILYATEPVQYKWSMNLRTNRKPSLKVKELPDSCDGLLESPYGHKNRLRGWRKMLDERQTNLSWSLKVKGRRGYRSRLDWRPTSISWSLTVQGVRGYRSRLYWNIE